MFRKLINWIKNCLSPTTTPKKLDIQEVRRKAKEAW